MASTNRESVKRIFLLGFVGLSVLLIGLIWAEGLSLDQPATPSYYRDRYEVDPNVYLTVTAEAMEFEQQLNSTPSTDAETHSGGQGRGQGAAAAATPALPTPTNEATRTP
jgi:hypothetical protein